MIELFALAALWAQMDSCCYEVTGVDADDVLNVRETADWRSSLMGTLGPEQSNILISECIEPASGNQVVPTIAVNRSSDGPAVWCRIGIDELSGWVNARFLSVSNSSASLARTERPSTNSDDNGTLRPSSDQNPTRWLNLSELVELSSDFSSSDQFDCFSSTIDQNAGELAQRIVEYIQQNYETSLNGTATGNVAAFEDQFFAGNPADGMAYVFPEVYASDLVFRQYYSRTNMPDDFVDLYDQAIASYIAELRCSYFNDCPNGVAGAVVSGEPVDPAIIILVCASRCLEFVFSNVGGRSTPADVISLTLVNNRVATAAFQLNLDGAFSESDIAVSLERQLGVRPQRHNWDSNLFVARNGRYGENWLYGANSQGAGVFTEGYRHSCSGGLTYISHGQFGRASGQERTWIRYESFAQ